VRFVGGVSDVRPFLAAADAFVLPTLYDPFPNAALEALACGLPTLTSTKSGAAEVVRDGVNGFVCDALDHAGLAAAMARIVAAGAGEREAMASAARDSVAGLSLDAMGAALIALYERLLESARP
jgi:UDP-glucose:(heptosyl)LPS alpha-1,3-glucosyltransferase